MNLTIADWLVEYMVGSDLPEQIYKYIYIYGYQPASDDCMGGLQPSALHSKHMECQIGLMRPAHGLAGLPATNSKS